MWMKNTFIATTHSKAWWLKQAELEVFALLGCYAVYVGSCLLTFQDSLSVPSSRVKQPKMMGPIGSPETSVNHY
jgi:hypothetical protein